MTDDDNTRLIAALKQTATHEPSPPNAAEPYVNFAKDFASGGLQKALGLPNNAIGRALQNPDNEAAIAALRLVPNFKTGVFDTNYHMLDEGGNRVGNLSAQWQPWRKNLYISGMESTQPTSLAQGSAAVRANPAAHSLGAENIRSVVDELRRIYPKADTISAIRSSGARFGPAMSGESGADWPLATMNLRR